jgi:hypothetical protein
VIEAEDIRFDWICPIDPLQGSGFYTVEAIVENLREVQ